MPVLGRWTERRQVRTLVLTLATALGGYLGYQIATPFLPAMTGALILVAWGMLVVGTIDNLLRPVLVGKRLRLHTVLAFMSVVGGLILFGPAGLILGPVALTATVVLLEIWPRRVATMEADSRSS